MARVSLHSRRPMCTYSPCLELPISPLIPLMMYVPLESGYTLYLNEGRHKMTCGIRRPLPFYGGAAPFIHNAVPYLRLGTYDARRLREVGKVLCTGMLTESLYFSARGEGTG